MTASAASVVGLKQSSKEPEQSAPALYGVKEAELKKNPSYMLHTGENNPFFPVQEGD